jgi:hypothetical protein
MMKTITMIVAATMIVFPSLAVGFSLTQSYHRPAVLPTRGIWDTNRNKISQHPFAIDLVDPTKKILSLRMSDTTAASTGEVDESSSSSTSSSSTEPVNSATTTTTKSGFWNKVKAIVPPANERQKLIPLALMFFCILFSYTILRDTKDVLMITAPKSGAEVIPFIKTYVNLPVAIVRINKMTFLLREQRNIQMVFAKSNS